MLLIQTNFFSYFFMWISYNVLRKINSTTNLTVKSLIRTTRTTLSILTIHITLNVRSLMHTCIHKYILKYISIPTYRESGLTTYLKVNIIENKEHLKTENYPEIWDSSTPALLSALIFSSSRWTFGSRDVRGIFVLRAYPQCSNSTPPSRWGPLRQRPAVRSGPPSSALLRHHCHRPLALWGIRPLSCPAPSAALRHPGSLITLGKMSHPLARRELRHPSSVKANQSSPN